VLCKEQQLVCGGLTRSAAASSFSALHLAVCAATSASSADTVAATACASACSSRTCTRCYLWSSLVAAWAADAAPFCNSQQYLALSVLALVGNATL
jgi:hypothetical protein